MGAVARWTTGAIPVSLVLAVLVLTGFSSLPSTSPGPAALSHLSPLGGGGPAITVAPSEGPIGATLYVNGTGFNATALVNVSFSNTTFHTVLTPTAGSDCPNAGLNTTTDASGDFACVYSVPFVSTVGAYSLVGNNTNTSTLSNAVPFEVTAPVIVIEPVRGPELSTFTATGSGFSVNSTAELDFNSAVVAPTGGSDCAASSPPAFLTNATGGFVCTFSVPSGPAGSYPVVAQDLATGAPSNSPTFDETALQLTVVPTQGPVGAAVSVSGTGFSPDLAVSSLLFDGLALAPCSGSSSLTTNSTGAFTCNTSIPSGASTSDFVATNQGGATAIAPFSVTSPAIRVSPVQGPIGSTVTVTGTNFSVSATVALSFLTHAIASASCSPGSLTTNGAGAFSCTFPVPSSGTSGSTVEVTDPGGQDALSTFTITTPALVVSPTQGPKGARVTVAGTGFTVSAPISSLTLDGQSITSCSTGSLDAGATGDFNCTFSVPAGTSGTSVVAVDSSGQTATGSFTVTVPAITVTPSQGPLNAPVTVDGTGFSVSSTLASLSFDGVAISTCSSGGLSTSPSGTFSCSFSVPAGTSGTSVVATDQYLSTASASFTVTSVAIAVTPSQGPQGAPVTVHGTGFTVSSSISSLSFDGVAVSTCSSGALTTNATGDFACSFAVPAGTSATTVSATDSNGQVATTTFTVTTPAITVAPGNGPVGAPVDIKGTGFTVSAALASLSFDSVAISSCSTSGSLTTNASGGFTCKFPVPSGTSGTTVRATDVGGQIATATFQVTSESITVAPGQGPVASAFVVTGTGFTPSADVSVMFGASVVAPTTSPGCTDGTPSGDEVVTSATGTFRCTFLVPSDAPAVYNVVAIDLTTTTPSNYEAFSLTSPTIVVTPSQGPIGSDFSVVGSGFSVSSDANVAFSGVPLTPEECTVGSASGVDITSNSTGAFACTFDVPTEGPSNYPIVASDLASGGSSNSVTFTVTAVAINVSPNQGPVGTSVTISGTGFSVSTALSSLVFDGVTVTGCTSGSLDAGATGAFACTIAVPSGTSGSSVVATDAGGQIATTQFTVTVPSITVSPNQGQIGSDFGVSGTGFQGAIGLTISIGGSAITPSSCSVGSFSGSTITASSGGAFGCTFVVATQPGGAITLVATQGVNQATATFTIGPSFAISSGSGGVGTVIGFSGSGFAAVASFSVQWNSTTTLCTGTTSPTGSLSCSGTVPAAPAGPHTITVLQGATSATGTFGVVPSIAVSPSSGSVGTTVSVTGSGFDAGESFIVTWQSSVTVCAGSTDSNGGFSCSFSVPSTTVGTATIMVSEGSYTPTFSFTVSAGPPPPSGSSPFPWWIVAVIALVAVACLMLGLLYEHRRHRRPRAAPPRAHGYNSEGAPPAWEESPGGPTAPAGSAAVATALEPAPVVPGSAAASTETNPEDIDALIARLERMSVQMFNKTPKQLSETSIVDAPANPDEK